jgi:hypothetical protein
MRFTLPLACIARLTGRNNNSASRSLPLPNACKGSQIHDQPSQHRSRICVRALALGFATFVLAAPALAATFANTDAATITMTGKIDLGDERKFGTALRYAPNFRKLIVHSPGGSIPPAILIGQRLRTGAYEVQVADNGECVSACTLLLAAAAERSAYNSSSIAVHSASTFEPDGTRNPETDDDLAVTRSSPAY